MNNNFYSIPKDWYKEFNDTFNTMDTIDKNNPNLVDPKEGFLRGNLFANLYDPYKNYKYGMLKATNEREELLYSILMYKFALKDLNLYLDNYPNNSQMINLYNKYLTEEKKLCNQYEMKYGPLTVDSENLGNTSWKWIKSPWPWEGTK